MRLESHRPASGRLALPGGALYFVDTMIGQRISHYTILEKLGEGGMGVVYKARDLTLNRIVALKFLPPHIDADDAEGTRLIQEARAASALNHPGICAIHAIGEHEGARFIDLEYVDGRTLGDVLREERLSVSRAVGYAIQTCEAIQEAHAIGIVHRDIKAENVMVTSRDRIKVMDFGLAKLKDSVKITRPLSTTGTLAYMAPELVQGGEADARSDIFALGVLLYEMIAGRLPFRGDHEAAAVYSLVHETPEPLSRVRREVSQELERVVDRALEKDPASRYQTASEIVADLRNVERLPLAASVSPGPPPSAPPSRTNGGTRIPLTMRWIFAVALGLLLAGTAWLIYRGGTHSGSAAPGGRKMLVVLPFENLGMPDRCHRRDHEQTLRDLRSRRHSPHERDAVQKDRQDSPADRR